MFIAFYLFYWEKLNCWNGSSSDQLICQNKEGAEIQWSLFWRDGFHVYSILFEGKHIYLILISHLKHLFKEALVHVYSHLIEDWCIVIKTKRKTRALKGIFGNKGTIKNICYMSSPQRDLFTFIVKSINWGNKSWRCYIDNIFGETLLSETACACIHSMEIYLNRTVNDWHKIERQCIYLSEKYEYVSITCSIDSCLVSIQDGC